MSDDATRRRVVLTGLGLVTPLGLDLDSIWTALSQGRSGVRRIRAYDPAAFPVQFGGEIDAFDARQHLDKKDCKRLSSMPRTFQLAVVAAQLAVTDAYGTHLRQHVEPSRLGIAFGTCSMCGDLEELHAAARMSFDPATHSIDYRRWGRDGLPVIAPMWLLNHIPNMGACHISVMHDAQGPTNTITQTDIAGLLALGEAYRMVQQDRADAVLAGGADAKLLPLSVARQCKFSPMSRRNDAPAQACRPFDRHRDGRVLGEGASVLVAEELDHARRRGAGIVAEVCGFAAAFDRGCRGDGLTRAIQQALRQAGIAPGDLDHINAHGLSTVAEDVWEARGLLGACGPEVPVFAPKSYMGNLGAAAGTTELACSLLAFRHRAVPGTLKYDDPDPACPVQVGRSARPLRRSYVLKVGCTERGQCAAVVCRAWDDGKFTC
jgi:3-oxoacyl-[acyl-carrier-protein] synthase II